MIEDIDFSNFEVFFQTGIPSYVLCSSYIILAVVILIGIRMKQVKHKSRFLLWSLLAEYVFIVLSSTILCRASMETHRLELMPFWDICAIKNHIPEVSIWDIILNIVLFTPFGLLLTALKSNWAWWKIAAVGLLLSLTIEISQYFLARGVAQTDDLMNNTLGAIVGFGFAKYMLKLESIYNGKK